LVKDKVVVGLVSPVRKSQGKEVDGFIFLEAVSLAALLKRLGCAFGLGTPPRSSGLRRASAEFLHLHQTETRQSIHNLITGHTFLGISLVFISISTHHHYTTLYWKGYHYGYIAVAFPVENRTESTPRSQLPQDSLTEWGFRLCTTRLSVYRLHSPIRQLMML